MSGTGPEASLTPVLGTALANAPDLAGLEPIERIKRRWPTILGAVLSLLMVAALGRELFGSGLAGLQHKIPTNPLFYIAFALFYLGPPTFDYLIFRRLWGIPLDGMVALHKKRIANEVLVGYSGEAYFYAWARQRTQMVAAPFGAVKDVTIQSAIAGNTFTLILILLVIPFMGMLPKDVVNPGTITASAALMIAMSLPFFLFSKRVFSLTRSELWGVFGLHMARLASGTLFVALAWHFALPEVSVGTWLFYAALRMLASRVPFIPMKEGVTPMLAILLGGSGASVTELLALIAALTLLSHIALIAAFGVQSLIRSIRGTRQAGLD
ncbi:hypothetical protein OF829_03935 [Sphingomonas sp. LB-2]|uniref:hypothetical protein n=1 Tax=Sphingomonas caeni TaxID=2984949 RepID=UPI00222F3012|nr:hypothetical protein [Sphingomonas caeni]MCW3846378.1 hypothetical protein [Sphingomonas caeni]